MKKNKSILMELAGKPLDLAENGLHKVIDFTEDLTKRVVVLDEEKAKNKKRLNELKQIAKVQELQMESLFSAMRESYSNPKDDVEKRLSEIEKKNLNISNREQELY